MASELDPDPTAPRQWASSHDTALCIISSPQTWPRINDIRSLYDKAYGKWPPHINLVYPFVQRDVLDEAADIVSQLVQSQSSGIDIDIQDAGLFKHSKHNTIYLKPTTESSQKLSLLANKLRRAFNRADDAEFQPHLTVAQSEDVDSDSHKFLFNKAQLLANTKLSWTSTQLAIMVRDETPDKDGQRRMKLWKTIDIPSGELGYTELPFDRDLWTDSSVSQAQPRPTYQYNTDAHQWKMFQAVPSSGEAPESLIVASYNVLAEFTWPPDNSRNDALVANILSKRAAADILVLQEVSDAFLPHLLDNKDIQLRYQYATHAPAGKGIGPLPSLINVVILSRFPMEAEYLPTHKKHKGAVVVKFPTIQLAGSDGKSLVVAGCHLTKGLVDAALTTKKLELLKILRYLSRTYEGYPAIIAGDFNLTTSSYAIDQAIRRETLSTHGRQNLQDTEDLFATYGFQDAWLATRVEAGESSNTSLAKNSIQDLHEGEQGATFDPTSNAQAAKIVGSGFNMRPHRYDRILAGPSFPLRPKGFNMFGQETLNDAEGRETCASDHWGIRCLFTQPATQSGSAASAPTIQLASASASLGGIEQIKDLLLAKGFLPSEEEGKSRATALALLEKVLNGNQSVAEGFTKFLLIPVGSYGLGVWMKSSDVDCLCVGSISSKTFFAMALQRLRKASDKGVTVLRRVKANSGTMLELVINGIKFDLQYCSAVSIVESYPEVVNYPSTHPVFSLPVQTLLKLKPARDLFYIRRSTPDLAKFRVAFLFLKAWAMSRGIYGAKYGLLGGIHLATMLVPVCKTLAQVSSPVSTADIVTTFFHHYSTFDWATQLVYDPYFHKDLKYHRISREPICLLGWHAPALNTAMAFSVPTVKTVTSEIVRTSAALSQENVSWESILGVTHAESALRHEAGVADFLASAQSFVKIDARFWGASPSQGRRYLGWLESRCIALLVDIDRRAPSVLPRIWPARFVDASNEHRDSTSTEYNAHYLISITRRDDADPSTDPKDVLGAILNALTDFETRTRNDAKYYDAGSCWLSASVVKAADVSQSIIDHNDFEGAYGESDDEDSEEEEEDDDMEDDDDDDDFSGSRKGQRSPPRRVPKPEGMGKFRSAADVMNRIRWDMSIDESDYIIGFLDRFLGAQEKSLGLWKTEQTDEEFIPQHRILYFKQKSTGEIMWERRTLIDRIFGSGIQNSK